MTITEFITKYNGKYCEVAGTSNAVNQCVDLANAYLRDVLGQPIVEWTNAKDFPTRIGDKFEYILNSPTNVPREGDMVVWSTNHIAIFIEGDANTFRSFDQNYPTGSPPHIQNHSYSSVAGWLRLKGIGIDPQIIQNSDNWLATLQRYNFSNNKDLVWTEIDKIPALEDANRQKDKEIEEKNKQLAEMQNKVADLEDRLTSVNQDLERLESNYNASQTMLGDLKLKVEQLQRENEELKKVEPEVNKPAYHFKRWVELWLGIKI